jgi:hypothetical protein
MTYIELPPWYTEDWDSADIEGERVPGLVHISGIARGPKWDRKPAKGQTGEKPVFTGYKGAGFQMRIRTWTKTQHELFVAKILPLLEAEPGKDSPSARSIVHPTTAVRKISAFYVDEDGLVGPEVDEEGTFSEWTVKAFEYRKPVAQGGAPGGPGLTPCQQLKAEYDHWTAQANLLGSKGVSDFDSLEAYQKAQGDYQAARDRARYAADLMRENGCSESTPASNAQAGAAGGAGGGLPPP